MSIPMKVPKNKPVKRRKELQLSQEVTSCIKPSKPKGISDNIVSMNKLSGDMSPRKKLKIVPNIIPK